MLRLAFWKYRVSRSIAFLCLFALFAVSGCSDLNRVPLNSVSEPVEQTVLPTPQGYLVFSQRAAVRAAKKVKVQLAEGVYSHSASHTFEWDDDEKLEIDFDDYGDKDDIRVSKVKFSVKKKSIDVSNVDPGLLKSNDDDDDDDREYVIDMAATTGTTLDDVAVAFGPSGMAFNPVAKLEIQLKGNLKGVLQSGHTYAYHIDADGHISKVAMEVEAKASGGKVKIEVPGFSRYSFDD